MFTKKIKVGFRKYKFKHKMEAVFLYDKLFGEMKGETEDSYKLAYCILLTNNPKFERAYPKYEQFLKVVLKQNTFLLRMAECLGGDEEKKILAQVKKLMKKMETH